MLGKTTNPLLQQTEQGVLQKVKPELKAPLERTVTAGLQVMYSKPEVLIQQLSKSDDFAHSVGEGSAKAHRLRQVRVHCPASRHVFPDWRNA